MADYWEEHLQPAKLGETTIPIQSIDRSGGRRLARHKYNYRDGQDTEDIGRAPMGWAITVPLYRGMKPIVPGVPLYPDAFESLRFELDDPDTRGEIEFVDPELGPVSVKVVSHQWKAEAGKRNGGVFSIKLEERNFDPFIFTVGTLNDEELTSTYLAEDIDTNIPLDEASVQRIWFISGMQVPFAFAEGQMWAGMVDGFFDSIEQGAITSDEIAVLVDDARARISVIVSEPSIQTAESWNVYQSLTRLSDSMSEAGKRVMVDAPRLVEFVVPWRMSYLQVAVLLYADVNRASEILRRNAIPYPMFIPKDTVLLVAEV